MSQWAMEVEPPPVEAIGVLCAIDLALVGDQVVPTATETKNHMPAQ